MKAPTPDMSGNKRPAPTNGELAEMTDNAIIEAVRDGNGNGTATETMPTAEAGEGSGAESAPATVIIESAFLRKLQDKFLGNVPGTRAWQMAPIAEIESEMADEFADVTRALFMKLEGEIDPPDGRPGSARQLIKELLDDTRWPEINDLVPVPDPWNTPEKQLGFRRYEAATSSYVLMRLYNDQGASGGSEPTGLPPDR